MVTPCISLEFAESFFTCCALVKIKLSNAADSNHSLFNNFFHQLLEQGIYLPPSGYETWFISDAINDAEIDKTLEAVRNFDYSDKVED